jgi:hypothetical protein
MDGMSVDKLIDITNRAVADYGFRLAVLYGSADVAIKSGLSDREAAILKETVLELLAALPVPVQPQDIPTEQARLENHIRLAT